MRLRIIVEVQRIDMLVAGLPCEFEGISTYMDPDLLSTRRYANAL